MEAVAEKLELGRPSRSILLGASTLPPMTEPAERKKKGTTGAKASRSPRASGRALTANRFAVLNAFVDCSLVGLTRAELATWLILFRDTRNGTASTCQADMARRAGISDRAVRQAIGKLRKLGLIVVVYQGGLNRGASRYRVEPLRKPAS